MQTQSAKQPLTHINLFSGHGGWDIAIQQWIEQTNQKLELRTVLYCEIESYCQQVIAQRQRDGLLSPEACIWDDVRTLNLEGFRGAIDILSASAPCQPFSVAGKQRQDQDERDMFPDTLRLISECRPRTLVLENVAGVLSTGSGKRRPYIERVLCQLTEIGYTDIRWEILSAKDVGAPHLRKRWLCIAKLADTEGERYRGGISTQRGTEGRIVQQDEQARGEMGSETEGCDRELEHPNRGRQQQCESQGEQKDDIGQARKPSDQELANPSIHRSQEPGSTSEPQGEHPTATPVSGNQELANTNQEGLERIGSICREEGRQEQDEPPGLQGRAFPFWTNNRPGLPEFPPSPDDHESWEWIITNRPDLAPAVTKEVESTLLRVPNGTAGKLDQSKTYRIQRLKMIGNGVVPATLALFLSRHIQD